MASTAFSRLVAELRDQLEPKLKRKGRPLKRAGEAVAGVLAVIAGLKPSYLYDIGAPNPVRLARAVEGIDRMVAAESAAGPAAPSPAASAIPGRGRCPLCVLVLRNEPEDGDGDGGIGTVGVFVADRVALRAALLKSGDDHSDDNDGSVGSPPMINVCSGDAATQVGSSILLGCVQQRMPMFLAPALAPTGLLTRAPGPPPPAWCTSITSLHTSRSRFNSGLTKRRRLIGRGYGRSRVRLPRGWQPPPLPPAIAQYLWCVARLGGRSWHSSDCYSATLYCILPAMRSDLPTDSEVGT